MFFNLDALRSFNLYWQKAKKEDVFGSKDEINFIDASAWLQDSAVIDRVEKENGQWKIKLVFAHPEEKNVFIVRFIRSCNTHQKANLAAQYMRRVAAKDPRGTVVKTLESFDLFNN